MFIIVLLIVATGTVLFMHIEGWTLIDALYYVSSTLTTVGAGELPITPLGRLVSVVYMWLGVAIVVSSLGFIGTTLLQQQLKHYFDTQDKK